jgi:hypothetical protein
MAYQLLKLVASPARLRRARASGLGRTAAATRAAGAPGCARGWGARCTRRASPAARAAQCTRAAGPATSGVRAGARAFGRGPEHAGRRAVAAVQVLAGASGVCPNPRRGHAGPCRHGHGTLTLANGDFYEGEWHEGLKHGAGSFTYAARGRRRVAMRARPCARGHAGACGLMRAHAGAGRHAHAAPDCLVPRPPPARQVRRRLVLGRAGDGQLQRGRPRAAGRAGRTPLHRARGARGGAGGRGRGGGRRARMARRQWRRVRVTGRRL